MKLWFPSATPAWPRAVTMARHFAADCGGATALEYSLLASLIAIVIAGICGMMFTKLSSEYAEISGAFG